MEPVQPLFDLTYSLEEGGLATLTNDFATACAAAEAPSTSSIESRKTYRPWYDDDRTHDFLNNRRKQSLRLDATVARDGTCSATDPSVVTNEFVHDLRNLLSGISLFSQLALLDLKVASPARDAVLQISGACREASELCSEMMNAGREQHSGLEQVDLSLLIAQMAPKLKMSVAGTLQIDASACTSPVMASSGSLRQVVNNLVTNASQALHDRSGVVTVRTGQTPLFEIDVFDSVGAKRMKSGIYAFVEVCDTGCGMDEATLARMFEPYFTTKGNGHGLGMASVARIVNGYGGTVQVHSKVGGGTTVRAFFPCAALLQSRGSLPTTQDFRS